MKIEDKKTATALALFSGGLDSILACRVILAQGIQVHAVKFVSPFFDYGLLSREDEYKKEILDVYGIVVHLVDISSEYIQMIRDPAHGYGKHFNPCVDCKIFMITKAKEMMAGFGASFLITGEVIGQRPMSQRCDTLRIIERDSGCASCGRGKNQQTAETGGILLRPLCAKNLEPTRPENEGLVDRDLLYNLSGRSRAGQMALAKQFGIVDYPTPAGGCILTDPIKGRRIKNFYARHEYVSVSDMRAITVGRQFSLPGGGWLVMGRDEAENTVIEGLAEPEDILLKLAERAGPVALLRRMTDPKDIQAAADLVARYGKKGDSGKSEAGSVVCSGREDRILTGVPPIAE
jgi:tRNA U34 2-thiouridine synthase MnmA/TrmU